MLPTFASLLRTARINAQLSQEELAEAAGVSVAAVSAYERGVRSRPYRGTIRLLASALHLSAEEETALVRAARQKPSLHDVNSRSVNGTPSETTSFVGRTEETLAIRDLLTRHRILTLVGPGGIGKTRLAVHVANMSLLERDAVYLVDFSSISDGSYVPEQVAMALGVPHVSGYEHLTRRLQNYEVLLIFDNCEHVVDAAGSIAADLLQKCPRLTILATSRERLRINGEAVYRIPILSLPVSVPTTISEALASAAIELFTTRATAADTSFQVRNEDCGLLDSICRRLDGIPLAIELAASQISFLGLAGLQKQLEQNLTDLGGGGRDLPARQRALRETIEWSYGLLAAEEQALFRRLSVFVGGCDLEAAGHVGGDESVDPKRTLRALSGLVDKSLINADINRQDPRYRMLDTTRANASEMLEQIGEGATSRRRHAEWFAISAGRAQAALPFTPRTHWLERYGPELENVRAALRWAISEFGDPVLGARIVGGFNRLWFDQAVAIDDLQGFADAVLARLDERTHPEEVGTLLLAMAETGSNNERIPVLRRAFELLSDPVKRASTLGALGRTYHNAGDLDRAAANLDAASEALGKSWAADSLSSARVCYEQAYVFHKLGRSDDAERCQKRAIDLSVKFGDSNAAAAVRGFGAENAFERGDVSRAIRLATESLEELSEPGQTFRLTTVDVLTNLSAYRLAVGQIEGAYSDALRALKISRDFAPTHWHQHGIATCFLLQHLGTVFALRDDPIRAAQIIGNVDANLKQSGVARGPTENFGYGLLLTALAKQLSKTEIDSHMRDGADLQERAVLRLLQIDLGV